MARMSPIFVSLNMLSLGSVVVGGVDISDQVRSIEIKAVPGELAEIKLTVRGEIRFDAQAAIISIEKEDHLA